MLQSHVDTILSHFRGSLNKGMGLDDLQWCLSARTILYFSNMAQNIPKPPPPETAGLPVMCICHPQFPLCDPKGYRNNSSFLAQKNFGI